MLITRWQVSDRKKAQDSSSSNREWSMVQQQHNNSVKELRMCGALGFDVVHPRFRTVWVSKELNRSWELRDWDVSESSSLELVLNNGLEQTTVFPAGKRGVADTLAIHGRPHAWCLYLAAAVPIHRDAKRCRMIQTVQLGMQCFVSTWTASSSHFHVPNRLVTVSASVSGVWWI